MRRLTVPLFFFSLSRRERLLDDATTQSSVLPRRLQVFHIFIVQYGPPAGSVDVPRHGVEQSSTQSPERAPAVWASALQARAVHALAFKHVQRKVEDVSDLLLLHRDTVLFVDCSFEIEIVVMEPEEAW